MKAAHECHDFEFVLGVEHKVNEYGADHAGDHSSHNEPVFQDGCKGYVYADKILDDFIA